MSQKKERRGIKALEVGGEGNKAKGSQEQRYIYRKRKLNKQDLT